MGLDKFYRGFLIWFWGNVEYFGLNMLEQVYTSIYGEEEMFIGGEFGRERERRAELINLFT